MVSICGYRVQDEFLLEEAKVIYASFLLKVRARDWRDEIGRKIRNDVVDAMSWDDIREFESI